MHVTDRLPVHGGTAAPLAGPFTFLPYIDPSHTIDEGYSPLSTPKRRERMSPFTNCSQTGTPISMRKRSLAF